MENLKFRRQFLLSAKKCLQLEHWNSEFLGSHTLYVHKDCDITRTDKKSINYVMIGYAINPHAPSKTTLDILTGISNLPAGDETGNLPAVSEISECLYHLAGRFVLILKDEERLMIFHDPCGLKTVYYTMYQGSAYAASQSRLLELVIPVNRNINYQQYFNSGYTGRVQEHYMPSGCSLYDDVWHLAPNHYYDSSVNKQIRYWPDKPVRKKGLEESLEGFTSLLQKTMSAAGKRFKLALAITAGLDSRMILSASKEITRDMYFYTLQNRNLTIDSDDLKVPGKLLSKPGLKHNIIDCNIKVDRDFEKIYRGNTDLHHFNDWGIMAYGMYRAFPGEYVTVRGNFAEIGQCRYYQSGEHPEISSYEQIFNMVTDGDEWKNIKFINNRMSEWFGEVNDNRVNRGYNVLDLFHWEHRSGWWQSQNQLEFDIVQEALTPFNNRELADIMLSVDTGYRCSPDWLFFRKSIERMWPGMSTEPINSREYKNKDKIKGEIKILLLKMGIFHKIKKLRNRLKPAARK
jgi:hypothetical protein